MMAFSTTNLSDIKPTELSVVTQYKEPFGLKIFRLSIFVLVILASLIGNSVVIKAVFENSTRKPLTHSLVTNMAVAELIGTILVPFMYVYQSETLKWPFGELLCHIITPLQVLSVLVITTTLAAIAVHRYRVFTTPQRGRISFNRIVVIIIILWVIALAISFPSFLFHKQVRVKKDTYWCLELLPGDKLADFPSPQLKNYYMMRFCCNYVLPIFTMMMAYGIVSLRLKHHRNRAIRDMEHDVDVGNTTQDTPPQEQGGPANGALELQGQEIQDFTPSRKRQQARERRRKAVSELESDLLKMIYAIILIFLICYFPYQIFFLLEYFGVLHFNNWQYFDVTRTYIFLLTCFPSALHPVCYGTMSKFYARTFSRLVLCKWSSRETA